MRCVALRRFQLLPLSLDLSAVGRYLSQPMRLGNVSAAIRRFSVSPLHASVPNVVFHSLPHITLPTCPHLSAAHFRLLLAPPPRRMTTLPTMVLSCTLRSLLCNSKRVIFRITYNQTRTHSHTLLLAYTRILLLRLPFETWQRLQSEKGPALQKSTQKDQSQSVQGNTKPKTTSNPSPATAACPTPNHNQQTST